MSLPAYLFLYDENGVQVKGECLAAGREGAIEIMSSSHAVNQGVDAHTGSLTGSRMHSPYILHKQTDKTSPYLAVAVCEGRRLQKAEIKYYATDSSGMEYECYRVIMENVAIMSVEASHAYIPGAAHPNMLEIIAIIFKSIRWHSIAGNIQYGDSWNREKETQ